MYLVWDSPVLEKKTHGPLGPGLMSDHCTNGIQLDQDQDQDQDQDNERDKVWDRGQEVLPIDN